MNSAILEGTLGTLTLSEEQRPIGGTDLVPNVEEQRAGQRVKAILATARELGINLTPQSRILDFGCGLGYYTLALRKMGLLSYGCDVFDRCQAMAQACRSITPEHLFSIVSLDDYRLPCPASTISSP
jgi:protein-L-isoaspartate O-methyltransferase